MGITVPLSKTLSHKPRDAAAAKIHYLGAAGRLMLETCSIVAALNHGKCSNGRNSSSSPASSQKPCRETLDHSAEALRAGKLKANLLVDSRDGMMKGGESGAAVVPGKRDDSLLLAALK
ncbi:MAG: c-type cytochrome domain-containing protein [Pirellulales bacterium]